MKALKPSHRENKRYLFLKGDDLKKNVNFTIKEFIGILGLSEAVPRWIELNSKYGILSINRKYLEKVRSSFLISNKKIKILKVSGTLKALKKSTTKTF